MGIYRKHTLRRGHAVRSSVRAHRLNSFLSTDGRKAQVEYDVYRVRPEIKEDRYLLEPSKLS